MTNLVLALIASFTITYLVILFENLHGHITADHDLDGVQKFHSKPVPRVGGIGVFIGLFSGELFKYISDSEVGSFGLLMIFASFPAFFGGLIEDLTKRVSVKKRLLATAVSAYMGGLLLGGWLTRLDIPFIDYIMSFKLFSIAITCIAIAGVANSFNLIDGYNGLTGMVGMIILAGLSYVAHVVGDNTIMIVTTSTIGALLGFFLWNYPRGLIFLGDGGAYLVGFIVAETSVLLVSRNQNISPWFPLLIASYPIIETLFTIVRRLVTGKNPGMPDADHLHQIIYRALFKMKSVSIIKNIKNKNSLTSPFVWCIAVLPCIISINIWSDTEALITAFVGYMIFYTAIYCILKSREC